MTYQARVKALRHRFGQETDMSIALHELAGLRRGKNQSAKELADSARRLASRAYYSNDYARVPECADWSPSRLCSDNQTYIVGQTLALDTTPCNIFVDCL